MIALGFDTSNYATSIAVVDTGRMEVVCTVKKMLPVPKGQCGLRQSDAVFHHCQSLPELMEEMRLENTFQQVQRVGVSVRPRPVEGSYMPCFLAGLGVAVGVASALGVKECRTSHQQGHAAAAMYAAGWLKNDDEPFLFFHISGGTTELLLAKGYKSLRVVGQSLDLYAGQAIDRLGVRLGYGFPAGREISTLAASCGGEPPPKTSLQGADCHLSGLQNQCEALLEEERDGAYVAKFCLYSIAETALGMIEEARKTEGPLPVLCAGGVMGSEVIRAYMERREKDLHFVAPAYSSDNAVGVALIAGLEG